MTVHFVTRYLKKKETIKFSPYFLQFFPQKYQIFRKTIVLIPRAIFGNLTQGSHFSHECHKTNMADKSDSGCMSRSYCPILCNNFFTAKLNKYTKKVSREFSSKCTFIFVLILVATKENLNETFYFIQNSMNFLDFLVQFLF